MKPSINLFSGVGNVGNICNRVKRTLKQNGQKEKANEFEQQARKCANYTEIMKIARKYVKFE